MLLQNVRFICRKQVNNGKEILVFFGVADALDKIQDDDEHLMLGSMSVHALEEYAGYKLAPNSSPNQILLGGGLDVDNYQQKLF